MRLAILIIIVVAVFLGWAAWQIPIGWLAVSLTLILALVAILLIGLLASLSGLSQMDDFYDP